MEFDDFPVSEYTYPIMVIQTIDAANEGIYTVTISAWLNTVPFFYATDTIVFTAVLHPHKCLLTWFDP